MTHLRSALASLIITATGAGFTKPFVLLKLDFLTSAYNKCMALVKSLALVRRTSLVKPALGMQMRLRHMAAHALTFLWAPRQDVLHRTLDTRHWTLREGRRQGGGGGGVKQSQG